MEQEALVDVHRANQARRESASGCGSSLADTQGLTSGRQLQ